MPCPKCGHMLILFDNDEICPKCNRLAVLDSQTAIKVATRLVTLTTKIFNDELRKWERDTLLGNLVAKREIFARAFFKEYSPLHIGRLVAYTMLIKKVVKFSNFRGKIPKEQSEIDKLVKSFEAVREFESLFLDLKSGYKEILYLRIFNEDSFTLEEVNQTFCIVATETYLKLERTFAIHDIFSEEKAEEKFKEYQREYAPIKEPIKYEFIPPDEYITKHYQILNQIFALFHRDKLSAQCFDLKYLDEVLNEPRDLPEFISTFKLFEDNTITICPTNNFIKRASEYFNLTKTNAKKLFVFDVNNKAIFPLFVRFRNDELGDVVAISKDFSSFIYTILHAIITRDLFDEETVRISKEFENEKVKIKFEENGYFYRKNIVDKKKASMQIDGLALKQNICYVIECKGWRFPRLIGEPDTKEHIIRDLKGIVLGEEYSYKNGQINKKDKPSLLKKLD